MTKGLQRSIGRAPGGGGAAAVRRYTYVINHTITVDGATGVGFGTVVIGDIPEGNIQIIGALSYVQFTGPTSGSLDDDWAGDYGIGTTPAGDATITGADVNIIPSTELTAATSEASPRTRGVFDSSSPIAVLDNTDGSLEVNLSLLVDDANIGADGLDFAALGELALIYTTLLDD